MGTKYELKNLSSGKTASLHALAGTIGPECLDISHLNRDLGVFTFDPGFMATASTESKITYIDGDAGRAAVPRLSGRAAGGEEPASWKSPTC